MKRMTIIPGVLLLTITIGATGGEQPPTITVATPMSPPTWALLQRQLLDANAAACREFYKRYVDERGWLLCVERWGGDDGPDDATESFKNWPILHALGAPNDILHLYKKAYEGHLRQFTVAKTTHVPFAKDGMYYKEFPVMFDWLHNGEGLCVFNLQGLSDPTNERFRKRVRRFAGFYLNEDPDAPNYDPKHKIIRSMFNGSRGPLLRKATALDWAGDPIEIGNRFKLGHGERDFKEMLAHFKDYNDIVGDHPQNLLSTCLAVNAYMLRHEKKYKDWVLEYVDAWRQRMIENNGIIPTNVGLDGKIGSEAGGKWYGGVYGWGFSVVVPQTGKLAHRNNHYLGFYGFMNAYLLTGDDRFLEPWRKQIDLVNSNKKTIDGKEMFPHMYGEKGWYEYRPTKYKHHDEALYVLSMNDADKKRIADQPWIRFLDGNNPKYPETALRADLNRVRTQMAAMRKDTTTPDTRLSDDPMRLNPASVTSMIHLALGGIPPKNRGALLHCRLRYFDPKNRRAGLPQDVAALIDSLAADSVAVTLVNTNAVYGRTVVVQAGAYAEHQLESVSFGNKTRKVDSPSMRIHLAPGCGSRFVFRMNRYANPPTLRFPPGV